ncbi:MAG: Nramp family divalent metal transporter [Dissulfuribacterales bacterium]
MPFKKQTLYSFLRYIGPGLLVTVGFIDPGNWASNVAAGAQYGYSLLWMVSLSTLMLILLQHNAAHLGIATGLCLSEAANRYLPVWLSRIILLTAVLAAVSTAMAEILGAAIALRMLFHIPLAVGATLSTALVFYLLVTNSYRRIEKLIMGFVSLIGLSFLVEILLVPVDWNTSFVAWVTPVIPEGSMPIVMSVLGAVVMPHNLFLHSEIIQSRKWNLEDEAVIARQMDYEFLDTLASMLVGWAINSAMILLAAATFFQTGTQVTDLEQAERLLRPIAGNGAAWIFALALLFAGIASSVTAGMAGGSIYAGMFGKEYDIQNRQTLWGCGITLLGALAVIFLISDPFKGLIYSQMLLSIQLPITILLQIWLTSSKNVMGSHANGRLELFALSVVAMGVIALNIMLLFS